MREQRNDESRRQAIELKLKGLTYAEIGKQLGVSRQRAQQLTRPPAHIQKIVSERAKGRCEGCGIETQSGHIHHLGGNDADYNDPETLQYLCTSCHVLAHDWSTNARAPRKRTK